MKTIILFLFVMFITTVSVAQVSGVNYKAIIKDNNGDIVANTQIDVRFEIVRTSNSIVVYTEQHSLTTDTNGLIILTIGQGSTSDIFTDIDWGRFEHSLKVYVDIGGGFIDMGTTQFQGVPYALQADKANIADTAIGANNLLLKSSSSNQFIISYSGLGDKLRITETGVAGNVLEISNGELYLPQYAGVNEGALKIDSSGKIVSEEILPPGPQETKINRYEFGHKEVNTNYTKYAYGIQFEDGTVIDGIKALLMDNEPGNVGVHNTAYVGIYRSSKTTYNPGPEPIYRIDGSDTPTDQFVEFTQTTLAITGSDIVDNTNYIYFFEMFICDNCQVQEASVLH